METGYYNNSVTKEPVLKQVEDASGTKRREARSLKGDQRAFSGGGAAQVHGGQDEKAGGTRLRVPKVFIHVSICSLIHSLTKHLWDFS